MKNRLVLEHELNDIFRRRSTADWLEIFEQGGLPAGPVLSITQMHEDPQTIARNMVQEVEHPVAGKIKTLGMPVKFSNTAYDTGDPAPLLGQHTSEILAESGYSDDEVTQLLNKRAAICSAA